MSPPSPLAASLARGLSSRGVRALLLRGPEPAGTPPCRPAEEPSGLELLVRSEDAARARAVLEGLDWNYQLGGPGTWRGHPVSTYSWAEAPYLWRQAPAVELAWGVTASPFPLGPFRELERFLWQGASDHPTGWSLPDAESLAVYLALQAARGGPRREERLRHLADCLAGASWERAERTATRSGIRSALDAAAAALPQGGAARTGGGAGPPYDGLVPRTAWKAGSFLGARAFPRRLRPWFSRNVGFGGSRVRCRFAGVEIVAGPGAFVPELPSGRLVELASKALAGLREPVVLEPGTGSGAIAIAVAARHPEATVHAVEKHGPALRWAKENARRQGRVRVHRGSLLDPVPKSARGRVAVIVANLPYVPDRIWPGNGRFVKQSVRGQDGDGLGLYRRLVRQARPFLRPGGRLILEMGPYQVDAFRSDVTALGYLVEDVQPEILGAVVVTARLGNPAGAPDRPADGSGGAPLV